MQLEETRPDSEPVLVGCPGCPVCLKHHGYIFHLSAGRPTKAHEYLFLLTKNARYYYDAEAIAEPLTGNKYERTLNPKDTYGKNPNGLGNGELSVTAFGAPHPYRNRRSVWTIPTHPYPEAHFATFPEKLVEPCVLAGTSERGCCPACGAPHGRAVERETVREHAPTKDMPKTPLNVVRAGWREGGPLSRTVGWEPTCECPPAEPVPCVVLDPFAGSGTVGVVCSRYHRSFIGVELNPTYVKLAERRIAHTNTGLPF